MTNEELIKRIGTLEATNLALTAMLVNLIRLLRDKGVFTPREQVDAFDFGLLKLKEMQAGVPDSEKWIFQMARERLEYALPRHPAPKAEGSN